MKIKKRWILPVLTVALCTLFMVPTTAFASGGEEAPKETVTEEKPKEEEVEKDTTGPALTPEGNLTLVDDVGHTSSKGKQFVTLVSKNGNYFYLIIDRDDKGNSTVHFLNQVDEMDLMALMNEEDAEKLKAELAGKEETNKPKEEPPVVEEKPIVEEKEEKSVNLLPFVVLVIVIAGGGIFAFIKFKDKKKKEEVKPDPDANYNEDDYDEDEDEDYDIFEIEDDEEVTEDEEKQ
ncbi:DUF4366 domain-containing protein [[Clostridium] innocuum]|uniref:DUF4366 domain-containing protein n=1 Tax=Clostridium innocuum TaxID=1522 RepID=UPI000C2FD72D|nr:DUF4366 domain-containing protein [[Clostridium] innocuum]MCR0176099.1 DUF4366 domain-containing protein [[Clostridium] innocuum]MCR0642915.1 DUF4366 domain-containing protein [[Clostridium] innocuum]